MSTEQWVNVYNEYGRLSAELIRILLESRNIPVQLIQEGAGAAYGLTVGPLGNVSILVPESRFAEAAQLLEEYSAGNLELGDEFETPDNKDVGSDSEVTKQ